MLFDTYAWVEFFNGTKKGKIVKNMLKTKTCYTSAISIAELSAWIEKTENERKKTFEDIKKFSTIISIDNSTLESAGIIKAEKRKNTKGIGLVDCIIISTGRQYNLQIVTGDKHFKEENALMI
ncbi:MAG: PIN domain-containing protein [Candidatus Diapherotrites archaeon]